MDPVHTRDRRLEGEVDDEEEWHDETEERYVNVSGVYDGPLDSLIQVMSSDIMECKPQAKVTIGMLVGMTRWIFETYPEARKPTADAEMVVLHATLEVYRCTRTEPKSRLKEILEEIAEEYS